MLMLTHTYILQRILNEGTFTSNNLDAYVYNIVPDLLTIHPDISSQQTHKIKKLLHVPERYPKAAYIMFHLLVDDLSHYGSICPGSIDEFNPDSQGYSYIRGKPLIHSLLNLHKSINNEISYNEAAYRSHLIIEMIYDLVIAEHINFENTISILAGAINFTAREKIDEFVSTINSIYNLGEKEIKDVMEKATRYLTIDRMERIMNLDGRIRLYADKFGLKSNDQLIAEGVRKIFLQARDLADDNEVFLIETEKSIKKHGWQPPVM
jgi:hypothetical protein